MLARNVFGGVFMVTCVLAIWTIFFVQFIPTDLGGRIALGAALVIASAAAIAVAFDPRFDVGHPDYQTAAKSALMRNPYARIITTIIFVGYMAFEAVSGAVFAYWTHVAGEPGEVELHIGRHYTRTKHNCSGYDVQEAPYMLKRVICAPYSKDGPPAGTPVIVRGMVSPVGVNVESYEFRRPPPPPLSADYARDFVDPPAPPAPPTAEEAAAVAKACPTMRALWPDWQIECSKLVARHFDYGWIVHLGDREQLVHVGPTARLTDDLTVDALYLAQ